MNIIKSKISSIELIESNLYKLVFKPMSASYSEIFSSLIRRILFTSVCGFAAVEVQIKNITHEYEALTGVKEDVLNILLNIKGIIFKLENKKRKVVLNLKKNGVGRVFASDIILEDDVLIINPNHVIANLTDENSVLDIKIRVEQGKGFLSSNSKYYNLKSEINGILLDVCFCPIKRVSYIIEKLYNDLYDEFLDKITFFIETNGSITAKKALKESIGFLLYQLSDFKIINKNKLFKKTFKSYYKLDNNYFIPISDVEFSMRTLNCINKLNIKYLGDLITYNESDLLKTPGLGKKVLKEIKKNLSEYNLSLDTKIENWDKALNDYLNYNAN